VSISDRRRSGDDDVLEARIRDAVRLCSSGGRARFVGFLDERQAVIAKRLSEKAGFNNFLLFGGYPQAERVYFGAFPEFLEPCPGDFPISALTVSFRVQDRLSHRDFLGALLHAGAERAAVGDILTEEGRCVLFCRKEMAPFFSTSLSKIGGVGVKISEGAAEPLPPAHRFEPFSDVVASARLDCLVASVAGLSREKASELIRSGLAMRNHEVDSSPDSEIHEGDLLSIRGKGRFLIDRLGPVTKKGRLGIAGRKYI